MISSIVFDEDEEKNNALQGNIKNIKKGIFAEKKEQQEEEDENEFLGADLATKNIKRELNNDFRKRGRKRRDVLEYEKLLNKDKIIEKLEETRNVFKNFYSLKNEKDIEKILFLEKKKDKKNDNTLLSFVKQEENTTIFSFENYIQFITVKKQSNEIYEKIFEYIFQNNLNIPFSILVINYFNMFVSLETCEKKINGYLDKNRLQEFFLEIKENNSSLSNIFSLKNVLNKESELKKFLLVFYYYFDFLKSVL